MPQQVWFPNMALTLVARATSRLPKHNYLFRCDPKYTKPEIKEYLTKLYGVKVERIATVNSLGKKRVAGRHMYKLKDYKKVYVRLAGEEELK